MGQIKQKCDLSAGAKKIRLLREVTGNSECDFLGYIARARRYAHDISETISKLSDADSYN